MNKDNHQKYSQCPSFIAKQDKKNLDRAKSYFSHITWGLVWDQVQLDILVCNRWIFSSTSLTKNWMNFLKILNNLSNHLNQSTERSSLTSNSTGHLTSQQKATNSNLTSQPKGATQPVSLPCTLTTITTGKAQPTGLCSDTHTQSPWAFVSRHPHW